MKDWFSSPEAPLAVYATGQGYSVLFWEKVQVLILNIGDQTSVDTCIFSSRYSWANPRKIVLYKLQSCECIFFGMFRCFSRVLIG